MVFSDLMKTLEKIERELEKIRNARDEYARLVVE